MKISRPTSKPPLSDAITFVEHAVDVAELYVQDAEYVPTNLELQKIEELALTLLVYSNFTRKLGNTLRLRINSTPSNTR